MCVTKIQLLILDDLIVSKFYYSLYGIIYINLSSISGLWRVAVGQIVQHHRGPPKPQQFLFPFWRDYSARDLPSNASTRGTRNDQNVIKLSRVTWKNKQQEVYLQKINICVYIYIYTYISIYIHILLKQQIGPNWGPNNSTENWFVHMKKSTSEKPIGGLEGPGTLAHVNSVCVHETPLTSQRHSKKLRSLYIYIYIYHIRYIRSISFLSAFCYDAN